MSFQGKITIDGMEFTILKLKFSVSQTTETSGRPNALPVGGLIRLSLEAPDKSKNVFFPWMCHPESKKDGRIVFLSYEGNGIRSAIDFKSACCVGYEENFDSTSASPMTLLLTISAKSLKYDETDLDNHWGDC